MLEELDRRIGDRAEQAFAFLEALVRAPSVVGAEQAALEVFEREARSLDLHRRAPAVSGGRVSARRRRPAGCPPGHAGPLPGARDHARRRRPAPPAQRPHGRRPGGVARSLDDAAFRAAAPKRPPLRARRRRHEERLCRRRAGAAGAARRRARPVRDAPPRLPRRRRGGMHRQRHASLDIRAWGHARPKSCCSSRPTSGC